MAKGRGLILAGSAAGIAAAVNTPLAVIVFAIEAMSRAYQALSRLFIADVLRAARAGHAAPPAEAQAAGRAAP